MSILIRNFPNYYYIIPTYESVKHLSAYAICDIEVQLTILIINLLLHNPDTERRHSWL